MNYKNLYYFFIGLNIKSKIQVQAQIYPRVTKVSGIHFGVRFFFFEKKKIEKKFVSGDTKYHGVLIGDPIHHEYQKCSGHLFEHIWYLPI
jgi:hypothetical protein